MRETHASDRHQELTTTDLAQVAAVADSVHRPAYRWSPRFGRFVHIGGPEIPDLDWARKNGAVPAKDGPAI